MSAGASRNRPPISSVKRQPRFDVEQSLHNAPQPAIMRLSSPCRGPSRVASESPPQANRHAIEQAPAAAELYRGQRASAQSTLLDGQGTSARNRNAGSVGAGASIELPPELGLALLYSPRRSRWRRVRKRPPGFARNTSRSSGVNAPRGETSTCSRSSRKRTPAAVSLSRTGRTGLSNTAELTMLPPFIFGWISGPNQNREERFPRGNGGGLPPPTRLQPCNAHR